MYEKRKRSFSDIHSHAHYPTTTAHKKKRNEESRKESYSDQLASYRLKHAFHEYEREKTSAGGGRLRRSRAQKHSRKSRKRVTKKSSKKTKRKSRK